MDSPVSSDSGKTHHETDQADRIKHLSGEARAAFQRFQASGDPAGLDTVICAILADFMPRRSAVPLAERSGSLRLIEDLALTRWRSPRWSSSPRICSALPFSNEEIAQVRTLDNLRGFICRKVAVGAPR